MAGSGGNPSGGDGGGGGAIGGVGGSGSGGLTEGGTAGSSSGGTGTGGGTNAGAAGDGGSGGGGGECAQRCLEELGVHPCGAWTCTDTGACVLASCRDDDDDGHGVGTACSCPGDCDDDDPDVTTWKTENCCHTGAGERSCVNGVWGRCSAGMPPVAEACDGEDDDCNGQPDDGLGTFTCGTGACAVSVPACVQGQVSACVPPEPTTTLDLCNGIDDDCDGAVDDDCLDCVRVAPTGDDADGAASAGTRPFRTVQAAIDFATAQTNGARRVCVAAGETCGLTASFSGPDDGELTMRSGIDVFGKYESTNWTRCADSIVRLVPRTGRGVVFGEDITEPTTLDGFAIDRHASAVTAGVTVTGANEAILSNLAILDGPLVDRSYGVNVTDGAVATITKSHIDAGRAESEAIAIRSSDARLFVDDNRAASPVTGWLEQTCPSAWIRGAVGGSRPSVVTAVLLDSSPGSRIERSSICATSGSSGAVFDGVRVRGDARGTVIRDNEIELLSEGRFLGVEHAVRFESCGGDSPWLVANPRIRATRSQAVGAEGDCHPVIDSNARIDVDIPIVSRRSNSGRAIACGPGSRCVISNNWASVGFVTVVDPQGVHGTGVSCAACPKISGNRILGMGGSTIRSIHASGIGLRVQGSAVVRRNHIAAGCSTGISTGVDASGGDLTFENNVIEGFFGKCASPPSIALHAFGLVIGGENVTVHSNYIHSGPGPTDLTFLACESAGIKFNGASHGVFRNNRIPDGPCIPGLDGFSFVEADADADPRVFENNSGGERYSRDYRDDLGPLNFTQLHTLTDMVATANITVCELAIMPRFGRMSCVNAGTAEGAPLIDIDGELRDAWPDIGADELSPESP